MTTHTLLPIMRPLTLLLIAALLPTLTSCGEEEAVPAERRCAEEGHTLFGGGTLSLVDGKPGSVEWASSTSEGIIQRGLITLRFRDVNTGDGARTVILRLAATDSTQNLLDRISEAAVSGPITITLVDATAIVDGSTGRTLLDSYDCDFSQGRLCAQLGVDSTGDDFITDADSDAANARSGTLTISPISSAARAFKLTWNMQLGANFLRTGSAGDAGTFAGCLDTTYTQQGSSAWSLR